MIESRKKIRRNDADPCFARAAARAIGLSLLSLALFQGAAFAAQRAAPSATVPPSPHFSKNDGLIVPGAMPCEPESEYISTLQGQPSPDFCQEWDPDYASRGHRFCAKPTAARRPARIRIRYKKWHRWHIRYSRVRFCPAGRVKTTFCDEVTPEQHQYISDIESGKVDALAYLKQEGGSHDQSYCGYSDGFLAFGRPLVATPQNRIKIRNPGRCTNYGTDGMVAMLEWVGRQISKKYSADEYRGVRLLVGDISAPRGGCLTGESGMRGHSSHTSGEDADISFLFAHAGAAPLEKFPLEFDPHENWWMIKTIFANPFVCVRRIFLDRTLIRKLARVAWGDPAWPVVRSYIQHIPGHKTHMHVRVGPGPGAPGCGGMPDDQDEEFDDVVVNGG